MKAMQCNGLESELFSQQRLYILSVSHLNKLYIDIYLVAKKKELTNPNTPLLVIHVFFFYIFYD